MYIIYIVPIIIILLYILISKSLTATEFKNLTHHLQDNLLLEKQNILTVAKYLIFDRFMNSFGYTGAFPCFCETHAESLDVLRWSESRWKHIHIIHHLFWHEIEKHMHVLMLLVLTNRKHLSLLSIFHVFSYVECACVAVQVFQTSAEKKKDAILQ